MNQLQKFLRNKSKIRHEFRPRIFNLSKPGDQRALHALVRAHKIETVSDSFVEQLEEYFQICNPTKVYTSEFKELFQEYLCQTKTKSPLWQQGKWIYYPWSLTLVHVLAEDAFWKVRTARNRNLITEAEQKKFYDAVVGIAGMSVGNSVALSIVLQGGARHLRIADFDTLALSNTNRIRTGIESLGLSKVVMTARQIYAINPYAKIEIFSEGLNPQNVKKFFAGYPKLDVVIDEIDNLAVKYLIREQARKYRLPIVMGADNGDNAVIDIERYDKNPRLKFFHGKMGKVNYAMLKNLDKFGIGKKIAKHLGSSTITLRTKASFMEIGKTIVSWPQLGGAAQLNGSGVAYAVRKIITGEPLTEKRAIISFDEKFIPHYSTHLRHEQKNKIYKKFDHIANM